MESESGSFIWDSEKELINIYKHGIDFVTAAKAFKDLKERFILTPDTARKKKGFSALVKSVIKFSRLGLHLVVARLEYLALDIGGRGLNTMKKKIRNSNKPIGKLTRIHDFLPLPEELVLPQETIKVTLSLKKSSVEFFKHKATEYHTKYQRMIRELLDRYATQYMSA